MIVQWIQAFVSGIAILASACIAVYVPARARRLEAQREQRRRLSVVTRYAAPSGLIFNIRYKPEYSHIGIRAEITLLGPSDAILHSGKFISSAAPVANGTYYFPQMDGVCIDCRASLQLVDIHGDESLSGAFYIMPTGSLSGQSQRILKAELHFQILTDSGEKLLDLKLPVSALNPPEAFKTPMPAAA